MDVKHALKSPDDFIQSENLNNEIAEHLRALSVEYQTEFSRLKRLKVEKKSVSSLFKDASEYELDELKRRMKAHSVQMSAVERSINNITQQTLSILEKSRDLQQLRWPWHLKPIWQALNEDISVSFEGSVPSKDIVAFYKTNLDISHAYQQPAIFDCILSAFGHDTYWLVARCKGAIVGTLALTLVKSPIFGNQATSCPYFNYGGPLSRYIDVQRKLMSAARQLIPEIVNAPLELRTMSDAFNFPVSTKKVSMVLPLPDSCETFNNQLGSKVRAQSSKANRYSPQIKFGKVELLDDFYRVFSTNMRDLGTPVYGKIWFKTLLCNDLLNTTIAVSYIDEKPMSCGFLLSYGSVMEIPWASTLSEGNTMDLNMWTYRQILHYAIEQGFSFFDFGRSTKNAPTYRFKKQWGAKPVNHYWYYPNSEVAVPENNPDNPKLRLLISIWKKLPLPIANWIGPPIVKGIS